MWLKQGAAVFHIQYPCCIGIGMVQLLPSFLFVMWTPEVFMHADNKPMHEAALKLQIYSHIYETATTF